MGGGWISSGRIKSKAQVFAWALSTPCLSRTASAQPVTGYNYDAANARNANAYSQTTRILKPRTAMQILQVFLMPPAIPHC